MRASLAARLIANELRHWCPDIRPSAALNEVLSRAESVAPSALAIVRRRCLFYACDHLVMLLVHRRVKGDAIAREEAVLYVQDRLQRDDFRRIDAFKADRGASFVTYMWQVVNNLLLDYLRAHGKRNEKRVDNLQDSIADVDGSAVTEAAEHQVQAEQLRRVLAETMSENDGVGAVHPLRAKLREHLQLTSKDRVFLKAMFQYDMSVGEICALPGFEMTAAEAYRCYYRIMEQLLQAFKQAGMVESLHSMVRDVAPHTQIVVDGELCKVTANRVFYLLDAKPQTDCHVRWRGATRPGVIPESFGKVLKRFAAYFTRIDAATAMSDNLLAALQEQWRDTGELVIDGVSRTFRIGARYLAELRRRFSSEKRSETLV